MNKKEEILIQQARQGQLSAFESLIFQYDAKLTSLIYKYTNNTDDTREIYQEVFLKVFKSIKTYRFQSEFYTWLFRIAVNTCLNYKAKKYQRQADCRAEDLTANWKLASSDLNPEEETINQELNEKIELGVQTLSPKQKAVFVLRHFEGYRLKEIANLLNYSEGTVKNYLFRATQKMKDYLTDYQST